MRSYEQTIACEPVDGCPTRFVWRSRIWRVESVQREWVETMPWWLVAPRGDGPTDRIATGPLQRRLWRVDASSGPYHGVYELACWRDSWTLVAAVD
ncbi:hypothetical protein SAMN05443377_10173 [Propionibacterium cyclohexanicum]|uniref:DUF6504 domain-containing protein n=1 Tax=Propionibacterium cyclohexanicum TaxID=64702 RepID=A0A1H9PIW7_9ACTN|nr:DUF6504 family protein [Propionibacterium cyclohexanicum]SER48128.1 hypothetical protein SAMN05443377_10173 [Propionibacterium cyclohexanicum]